LAYWAWISPCSLIQRWRFRTLLSEGLSLGACTPTLMQMECSRAAWQRRRTNVESETGSARCGEGRDVM
jgi:hypothetical protein